MLVIGYPIHATVSQARMRLPLDLPTHRERQQFPPAGFYEHFDPWNRSGVGNESPTVEARNPFACAIARPAWLGTWGPLEAR